LKARTFGEVFRSSAKPRCRRLRKTSLAARMLTQPRETAELILSSADAA
jgi:hypothetical protein